ncbi:uncharacterized protein LOC120195292 isoform X1 [Hibiscus syriacus]|uniref:uncharacterized protein LOC120195292 isoform X1 n=1 Tax=Hibiscus syriacus TaxID=106335 RepID=UPI0019230DFA|nr:uncharacterized protein LOC120195292 isoform X1 [Hibiscus syriacus]
MLRENLRSAYLLLIDNESANSSKHLEEVQKVLKSAASDCVVQERNSFVAFQANTGVEVCTYRLIVKNAYSLLEKKNPVKLEAEAMLDDLISSFTSLNRLVNESDIQVVSNRHAFTLSCICVCLFYHYQITLLLTTCICK